MVLHCNSENDIWVLRGVSLLIASVIRFHYWPNEQYMTYYSWTKNGHILWHPTTGSEILPQILCLDNLWEFGLHWVHLMEVNHCEEQIWRHVEIGYLLIVDEWAQVLRYKGLFKSSLTWEETMVKRKNTQVISSHIERRLHNIFYMWWNLKTKKHSSLHVQKECYNNELCPKQLL